LLKEITVRLTPVRIIIPAQQRGLKQKSGIVAGAGQYCKSCMRQVSMHVLGVKL
jgi:hypothetical protein